MAAKPDHAVPRWGVAGGASDGDLVLTCMPEAVHTRAARGEDTVPAGRCSEAGASRRARAARRTAVRIASFGGASASLQVARR
jgi:hypothetical protein